MLSTHKRKPALAKRRSRVTGVDQAASSRLLQAKGLRAGAGWTFGLDGAVTTTGRETMNTFPTTARRWPQIESRGAA